ncbi:penicillin-binding protein [Methylobacterium sp. 37f]|nr:penicillin-binding protein [Methylobacterium sp. 37f]
MTIHTLTRRSLFGGALLLGPLMRVGFAMPSYPRLAAIRITEAADTAHRAAGLVSASRLAGGVLSPEWRVRRIETARARFAARSELHALTPTTRAGALALVRYYGDRVSHAHPTGAHGAKHAALRRLREVFARPGAYPLDCTAWASLPIPAD